MKELCVFNDTECRLNMRLYEKLHVSNGLIVPFYIKLYLFGFYGVVLNS